MKVSRAEDDRVCNAQALELIHEDRSNRYYLSTLGAAGLVVQMDDGSRINLRQALIEGRATVAGLRAAGVRIVTVPK